MSNPKKCGKSQGKVFLDVFSPPPFARKKIYFQCYQICRLLLHVACLWYGTWSVVTVVWSAARGVTWDSLFFLVPVS